MNPLGPFFLGFANLRWNAYLCRMTFDFCLPTKSTIVPATPDWLHEVKYDGYRLRVERDSGASGGELERPQH